LFAEGNAYRRAAEQPHGFIVVLGIWLIFSVTAWAGVLMAFASGGAPGRLGVVAGGAMAAVSIFIIAKTTSNYRKRQRSSDAPCAPELQKR
jgi:hypothetical protein